jgi:hypothetical protein
MEDGRKIHPSSKRQQGGWNEQGDRTGMIHTNIKSDYCYSYYSFPSKEEKMTHQIGTHVRSGICFLFPIFPHVWPAFEVGFSRFCVFPKLM